jgi:hypothetical protein
VPKLEELYAALERAAQANDDQAAREIASYIKVMQPPVRAQAVIEKPEVAPEKASTIRRAGDIGLSAIQGAIAVPESIVGLADIPTGGRVGKALEGVGFKPQEAKQILQTYKSPEQQAAESAVSQAEGFIPTVQTALQNPSAITSTIAQSLPSMIGGAGIARGVLSAAPKVGALAAGAIGEGAVGAGLSAEDIRQQTETGLLTGQQAGLSTLSGVFTGVLGGFGGKVAQKYLNVGDIDTILAGGASTAEKSGLLTSMFKAGLSEAVLEELPQSGQEQVMRNLALNKPWDEGVAESMAMGVLAALPMGAGAGYSSYRAGERKSEAEEKQRQAALAASSAERARQADILTATKTDAEQAQYAGEERAADIAGKADIDAQISKEAADYQAQQAKVKERQGLIQEAVKYDVPGMFTKTESAEGVKDLLTNFDNYFYFPKKEDGAALRKMLQQQLNDTKKAETKAAKLSDTDIEYTALADVQDSFQKQFGVTSEPELATVPLAKLKTALMDLQTEQPGQTNKYVQKKFDLAEQKLNDAINAHPETLEKLSLEKSQKDEVAELRRISQTIRAREKELALFDNDPMKKAAFEKGPEAWAAYQAQEQAQAQIPDEAFPVNEVVPEVPYEEKMAQLERAPNEQEIEDFQLEEQYQNPTMNLNEEPANEAIEQAPAGQRGLFTKFEQPTAAALRGTSDTSGVSETKSKRANQRDAMPSPSGATDDAETEAAVTGPLGDVSGATGRSEVRAETSEEAQSGALSEEKQVLAELGKLLKAKEISVQEYRGYADTVVSEGARAADDLASVVLGEVGYKSPLKTKPETTKAPSKQTIAEKRRQAEKELASEVAEAKQNEDLYDDEIVGYDDLNNEPYSIDDENMMSRKAKPKKGTGKPKDVSGKLRAESTEPTTPELFAEKITQWFNPVWYKQAVKNGMVNIVDGDINASDLPDATKAKYSSAKALFTPDGKAYFFLQNITKGNELGVFLHEIGEHKGLDNLIGKDRVKQLANRVRQMAEGKGSAKEVAMAKQAIEMAEGQAQNDKEVIAYFGEIAVFNGVRPGAKAKPEFGKAAGWVTELWSAVKKAIEKMHLNIDKVSDKDIVDMLYGAARLEMGAVKSFEEQVGEPVPNEPEILASIARNPELELSPEEAAARKARGLTVRPAPQRQTMKEKMQQNMGMSKGRDEFFNRMGNAIVGPLFTIHRKATEYYGPEGFYTKSTGRLLGSLMGQHSLNANNFTFEAIKQGGLEIEKQGFIKSTNSDDNIVNLNQDYNELLNALQADGVSKATAYQQIANMILADRYKSLKLIGAKSTDEFTKEDAAEGYALREKHKALYDKWRNRYNAMRKNKIDFLVQSGTYTQKEAETLMNRLEYVPLYRIKDSEGADGVFMQGLLSSKQQQKLQFDTKNYDVADIMTNIALNEMWLYKKAIFNHTTNLLIDQVEEMGGGKHVKLKNPNDEQTIAYLRDGEIQFFKFDDPNDMAMLRAVPVINNWAVNQMRFLGGILRKTITLTPSFIYRQVWQDVERGWMQSGTNQPFHKMLGQSIREQAKNAKRDSETRLARELRSRGVIGAVEYQDSFENAIDELFGRDAANKSIFEKAYKKLEYMEKLAQNSDMAARAIVYENAVAEGATEGEAALRAQMMLNYQHRGTSPAVRALLSTIPFINTKLQSEWRLVEALQGKIPGLPKAKAKQLLAAKILKMATLSAAYAMMRAGDDDYEEASDEQRNRNFLISAGGIPLRIPVAPEYMLIKAGMEQATRLAIDAEFASDRKLGHAVASSIGGLLLGVDDVMPSVLRPLLENMTNYSFFNDRALVGQGLQQRDVNLQFVEGQTSELAKFISDSMQAVGGNVVNVSPIKIDNFINGVFGTMGRDVLFATNLLAESITGNERPELKLSQLPELGTAFYNPEGSQRVADYYQVRDKVMSAYNSYRSLVKTDPQAAREYLEANRNLIALRGPVDAIGNTLEQLRARQNRILADDKLSEEEKRVAIQKITEQKNRAVTEPTKMIRKRME